MRKRSASTRLRLGLEWRGLESHRILRHIQTNERLQACTNRFAIVTGPQELLPHAELLN